MANLGELLENEEFMQSLEKTESYEDFKKAFDAKGVDIENLGFDNEADELNAEMLENVAGGMNANDLIRIVKASVNIVKKGPIAGAWTFGKSYGILMRAYYDIYAHGSATYSYSEAEIMGAARAVGVQ